MSQVRGRIKTVVNYDDRLTVIGTCCENDGTKTTKTLSQCSQDGGRWVPVENPDDVTCPALSDRGCCCACAYTTKNTGTSEDWTHPDHAEAILGGRKGSSNGLKNNVTKCECEYYEGNWNDGVCPENPQEILSQCATEGVEGRDDVRWPFACCHCEYDANNEVYRECANVCLSRDCAALGEGFEGTGFNCTPEFDRFEICDYETSFGGLPKECPEVTEAIPGCTNPECDNYNPEATEDDGSCPEPCGPPPPPPEDTGACCVGNACSDGITPSVCSSSGGIWQGINSTCLDNPCDDDNGGGGPPPPPNLGACCQGNSCSQTTLSNCSGDFKGVGVPCTNPNPCTTGQIGACCIGNQCSETTEDLCLSSGGSFQGAGSSCDDEPCGGGGGSPPAVECEPDAGKYDIPVDVSYLEPAWDVNTVYRPRNDAGEFNSEDGPTVYQQASLSSASAGWAGCASSCSVDYDNCYNATGCGNHCNLTPCEVTGSFQGSRSGRWRMAFRDDGKKTLDISASDECIRICHQGPNPEFPNSQEHKDWGFATKKLGPPQGGWKKWAKRLNADYIGEDPNGQPAIRWSCDGPIKHPYEPCSDDPRPIIDAPYIGPLDGFSSDPDYPTGGPPGVVWEPETPWHVLDGGYYDLREIDGDGGIKELWNARYADAGLDWDAAIGFGFLKEGSFEDDDDDGDGIPDNYNEYGFPIPPDSNGFFSPIYSEELRRQWDFGFINANLDQTMDGGNNNGPETGDLFGQSPDSVAPCEISEDDDGEPGNGYDECKALENWWKRIYGGVRTRLTTHDPLVNGIPTEIEPRTQRCYDVCMEPDTPLHLKKYAKPDPVRGDLAFSWWSGAIDTTCGWNPEYVTNYSGYVLARTYDDAVSQCSGDGLDILPGTWKPDNVNDFWVSSLRFYAPGWRWWNGYCWFDETDDPECDVDNLMCWFKERWWNRWDYGWLWSLIVSPTASIFGKNLPGGVDQWIGQPGVLSNSYGSLYANFYWYPDDLGPYTHGWQDAYNPFEFFSDGSSLAQNGLILSGFTSSEGGPYIDAWDPENFDLTPISNYADRQGICLNTLRHDYSILRRGPTRSGTRGCASNWRCCKYNICNDDCQTGLLPQERGEGPRQPDQPKTPLFYANPSDAGIIIENSTDASACCTLDKNGVFKCEYKSRKDCEMQNGFYNVPDDDGPITCSSTLCQKAPEIKKSGFVIPPKIKSSDLPEPGTIFAGGVYIGTFTPGVSQVLSNIETGSSTRIKTSTKRGPGDDKRKWALILSPNDLGMEFGLDSMMYRYLSPSETVPKNQTSLYDGLFNTYGNDKNARKPKTNLLNQIRNYNLFSFRDWYLPSIEELGFVGVQQKDLDFGVNLNRYSQNQAKLQSNVPYMSSSRKMTKKVKLGTKDFSKYPAANFIYSVLLGNALGPMNGFTVLSGLDNTFRVRLVRRIYVED